MARNAFGAFVISWAQVELDGRRGAALDGLVPGASLRWRGEALRVDGPQAVLPLGASMGGDVIRKRAAHRLRQRFEETMRGPEEDLDADDPLMDHGFAVTDGIDRWNVAIIDLGAGRETLCLFDKYPPKPGQSLWVVASDLDRPVRYLGQSSQRGVICFTPGTQIRTGEGSRAIEDLREGDLIQTKDNGLQPVMWIGGRHLSGARLRAMPGQRPVRLRPGALGDDAPDSELLVSPDHRVVLRGPRAQALFNSDEVLVTARDLVDDTSVLVDGLINEVTYIHLATETHQVVFANGVETESFHPMAAGLDSLTTEDRVRLLEVLPQVRAGEGAYGHPVRRVLTPPEAAILRGAARIFA